MDSNDDRQSEKQEIWSWGAGTDGQLATGLLQDEHIPQLLPFQPSLSFISCGGAHVVALTPGKKVFTWGRGTSGQLGHGNLVNSLGPKSVDVLNNFKITNVSAGWNHSGFVTDIGHLLTCGDGSFGQLGLGDNVSQCSPVKVLHFESWHVQQIAFGMRHSLALLKGEKGDQVYSFGSGKRGQLGISNEKVKSISLPMSVSGLDQVNVGSIVANGDHSAAISDNGHLYTWGRGFDGKPGMCFPERVISMVSFTQVSLGWNHALILTEEGEALMLGSHHGVLKNHQIQNLTKHNINEEQVKKICGLNGIKVVGVASGAEHSVLTTENGAVLTWGWGEHGQLGLGDTRDHNNPQVVSMGQSGAHEYATSNVYCGSGFTFVVRNL
ncbi:ultraviolet-B receptor UVR8 [Rutidosis leptorrhynchoides]|uniref:ultraviolet-B receptor UVR8 n=1 Tax=Rutidosis leptorrhynchoides TaxID=125765 RepID=UPI003A99B9F6